MTTRALGIVLGVAADAAFGDPPRYHPVAWFGSYATSVEKSLYADEVAAGARYTVVALLPVAICGTIAEYASRRHPIAHVVVTATATWAVLGAKRLADEGREMAERLEAGDLAGARRQLPNLCGRDATQLDEPELARATVESMAENTADAAVASLFWGALGGVPGLLVHRAANTLDAMVGHRNERFARFGSVAARFDDLLDWVPARLTGALACVLAPVVGGSRAEAWRIMRRDGANHPSPNGGWCESAWAGVLGVQLGGRNIYASRVEERGLLGEGPRPGARDLRRASRLVRIVTWAAAGSAALVCVLRRQKVR